MPGSVSQCGLESNQNRCRTHTLGMSIIRDQAVLDHTKVVMLAARAFQCVVAKEIVTQPSLEILAATTACNVAIKLFFPASSQEQPPRSRRTIYIETLRGGNEK